MISLLAGKPNADTFPITSLQFTLRDPLTNEEVPVSLSEDELARSLQYSGSKGVPDLLDWLIGLQEFSHGRKRGEGWDLAFGTGSSDLIYKVPSPNMFLRGCYRLRLTLMSQGCERDFEFWGCRSHRGSCLRVRFSAPCLLRK